jgi:hypothetical protein
MESIPSQAMHLELEKQTLGDTKGRYHLAGEEAD